MSWTAQFESDALDLALPDWERREDDHISVGTTWDRGGGCPTCDMGPEFSISVTVQREDLSDMGFREYTNEAAVDFFSALMCAGSRDS